MPFADLQLTVFRGEMEHHYEVEPYYNDSDNRAGRYLKRDNTRTVRVNREELQGLLLKPVEYGRALSQALFADHDLKVFFAEACADADKVGAPLHLRLRLTRKVLDLHGLRWELLHDPNDDQAKWPLTVNEKILFSRYIDMTAHRAPRSRPPDLRLKAVVAVCAPDDVDRYTVKARGDQFLGRINARDEEARARAVLAECELQLLTEPGAATLENLAFHASARCDVLYLVCHGTMAGSEPQLYLVNADNTTKVVKGRDLVTRLEEWYDQPFVVVFASCESGGREWDDVARLDEYNALAAIGPQLAEAGVPAVLAMQGNIAMETWQSFMPRMFGKLLETGSVDHAVTVARGQVRTQSDFWMPVLFSRVPSGEVWYTRGLQPAQASGNAPSFKPWDGLLKNIRDSVCTPILGFGLLESLVGTRADIAHHWAERYHYPLAELDRQNLARMAQFVAVDQSNVAVPADQLKRYLKRELLEQLDDATRTSLPNRDLETLLEASLLGPLRKELGKLPDEPGQRTRALLDAATDGRTRLLAPYVVLAALPFRTYLSATPDPLLEKILAAVNRTPQVGSFNWWDDDPRPARIQQVKTPDEEDDATAVGRPPLAHPLVYRLFGSLGASESLVLTEDSHLEYLAAMVRALHSRDRDSPIPAVVRAAFTESAVLFLGFRATDWDFRVLVHSIRELLGEQASQNRRRQRLFNVFVQLDVESGRVADVGLARRYVEQLLGHTASNVNICVCWGKVEIFLAELGARFRADQDAD